jgi:flagellar assembly protein FliH
MAAVRKFLFERSFDVEEEDTAEPAAPAPAPEVVVPTFSEEEMNTAREQAFAQGRDQGLAEAAAATEQAILQALSVLDQRLAELLHFAANSNAAATDDAVAVAVGIVRKLFPALSAQGALAEVERMAAEAMHLVLGEPRLAIYVNEAILPALAERIEALSAEAAYRGQVELKPDAVLPPGDCRVEWADGGAQRDTAALWRAIDAVLERNLAGAAIAAAPDAGAPSPGGDADVSAGDAPTNPRG